MSSKGFTGWRGLSAGALLLVSAGPVLAHAQSASDSAAYARAREMVANGDAARGRRLADSVAATAATGSGAFAEGLYWRAALAENARDSERYYRQIIVDYPLSGRVPDALLRIGQLESARGDNAAALQHFQRLVLEHPESPLRSEASYWVAQMYFKANDAPHACSANADALASVRASNVELKNRIDFQQQRCRGVALASAAQAPVTVPVDRGAPAAVAESSKAVAPRKAETKAQTRAEAQAAARVAERAAAKARADSIATERALERVKAESLSLAKAAEARELKDAKARAAAASRVAKASAGRTDSGAKSGTELAAPPGAVTREPTKEEVARALASAEMPTPRTTTAKSVTTRKSVTTSTRTSAKTKGRATRISSAPSRPADAVGTGSGLFAIQIAAFRTREPALELARKMRGRGYDAYVDGGAAPYRVRMGHYKSHAAATAELEKLKARQIDGFVAER